MLRSGRKFRNFRREEIELQNTNHIASNDNNGVSDCHPALMNDVVLSHLFKAIPCFYDLKSCRKVCSKWKSICEPIFRKRAKASFDGKAEMEDLNILKSLFSNVDVPITTLELSDTINWKVPQLQSFFQKEGRIITELEFRNFNMLNRRENHCRKIGMTQFVTSNLKKLTHFSFGLQRTEVSTILSFSTARMLSLDSITLTGATILLDKDCFISPKTLSLRCNKYIRDGKECSELFVHEFVNFDRLEKLALQPTGLVTMSLDLQGSVSIRKLWFSGKDLVLKNWENSGWCTQDLSLYEIPLVRWTSLTVLSELKVCRTRVDIHCLPRTIKKLTLTACDEIFCTSPITLCQLQSINSVHNSNLRFLSNFSTCPNLENLHIINEHNQQPLLNVDHIPRSIKRIFMEHRNQLIGNNLFELEALVISNILSADADYLNDLLTCPLIPKHLIVHHSFLFMPQIQGIINFHQDRFETVVFGHFNIPCCHYSQISSLLSNYVDKNSAFYIFKDGRGTALTLKKIHEIVFGKDKAFRDYQSYWTRLHLWENRPTD